MKITRVRIVIVVAELSRAVISFRSILALPFLILGVVNTASATMIATGSYYLHATDGFYPFPGGIGVAEFHGRPFGPGNTDTIYEILAPVDLPALGTPVTVPIEVVRLDVESVAPIEIGGTLFDMFIHLRPGTHSLGELTVTQTSVDDGGTEPEGIFDQNVTLVFTAEFTPIGGGPGAFSVDDSVFIETVDPVFWSFDPEPFFVNVTSGPQQSTNFFPVSTIFMLTQPGDLVFAGGHKQTALVSGVPEPPTVALVGVGLFGLLGYRWRYRKLGGPALTAHRLDTPDGWSRGWRVQP